MYKTHILSSINEIPKEWESAAIDDIFLSTSYLAALNASLPNNIDLRYVFITRNDTIVGFALIQHVKIYVHDTFRQQKGNYISRNIAQLISYFLKGEILVVGNLTQTGQHGVYFNEILIERNLYIDLLFQSLHEVSKEIRQKNKKKISAYLFKDYSVKNPLIKEEPLLIQKQLYKVNVQPNMVLSISPRWSILKDYYEDLNKKYKRRFRTARNKIKDVNFRELSAIEIDQRSHHLHTLYLNVSNNARFNTFVLPVGHFNEFKTRLDSNFKVFGYFLDNRLIGFYSLILNKGQLETYFLGYDQDYQYERQLYLNMLYDMLEFGIVNKFKSVIYARTAMEIKSSVGAKPLAMEMYIKHTNKWVNRWMQPLFNLLDPTEEWEERHPFA